MVVNLCYFKIRRYDISYMKKVMIKEAIKTGWHAFSRRPLYLLGLTLAFVLLTAVSTANQIITALTAVLYGGYIMMMIRHLHGEHIVFDDLFAIQDRWVSYAGLVLIKTFLIILGLLCFVIPGIYLAIRWMFAEMLVVDQNMKPIEALKASSKLTEGVRGKLFLLVLVLILLIFIGVLFFIIGMFIMSIVSMFAYIKVYEDLKPKLGSDLE